MNSKTDRVEFNETIEGLGHATYSFGIKSANALNGEVAVYRPDGSTVCHLNPRAGAPVQDKAVKEHMIARLAVLRPIAKQILGVK